MSDQSQSAGTSELAQPAIGGEGNETETTAELDTTAIGDVGSDTEGDGEQELDDLDFGFKKWRVPKELKAGVDKLNATFTQKSQELSSIASKAAELEAREARLAEQSKLAEEEVQTRVSLSNIIARLDQYNKLTEAQWAEMKDNNYEAWNEHRLNVISLQNARSEAQGKLSEHETKRTHAAEADYRARIEQTQAFASKLPGWTPELDRKVVEFAISKGLTGEQITRNMSPAFYDTLRLARIGEEVLKKQAAAKATPAPTPAEPLEMVGAKKSPPPAGLDDKLDIKEWIKRRDKQAKARAN